MVHEVVRVPFSSNCFLNSLSLCQLSSLPYCLLSLQSALRILSVLFLVSSPHPPPLVAGPGDYIQGTTAVGLLLGARPFPEKGGGSR